MKLKTLAISFVFVLALCSITMAQETEAQQSYNVVLEPDCAITADANGFFEVNAYGGFWRQGYFYCQKSNMTVAVGGSEYQMDRFYNCSFSINMRLADGQTNFDYLIATPEGNTTASCTADLTGAAAPDIVVYSPKDGAVYGRGDTVFLEIVAMLNGANIKSGEGTAVLYDEEGAEQQAVDLSQQSNGVFKGELDLDCPEGEYSLAYTVLYDIFEIKKNVSITIGSGGGGDSGDEYSYAPELNVLYPSKVTNFEIGTNISFEVEFLDENNFIISNADVGADVIINTKDDAKEDSFSLARGKYAYKQSYVLAEEGFYEIAFHAMYEGENYTETIYLTAGNKTEISEIADFSVEILSPISNVYAANSEMVIRAKVREAGEPVSDADVVLSFDGKQYAMEYDSYGDYIFTTDALSSGTYEARITANYEDYSAQDSVIFMASEHEILITPLEPAESSEVALNESVTNEIAVKADIRDEYSDIIPGAAVFSEIVAPNGKKIDVQLLQDPLTGAYTGSFYAEESGMYKVSIAADKSGYVGSSKEVTFTVTIIGKGALLFGLTNESLTTIIMALVIALLIVLLLRAIF
ncbi:MAG: hypothetical protein V1911_01900 [Candidatus Micrarchaeota archaeon]